MSEIPVYVSDDVAVKSCVISFVFVLTLPLIICDYFFAFNQISCQLKESFLIALNLQIWLIVMASLNLFTTLFTSAFLCFSSAQKKDELVCFGFISKILKLFIFSWTFVGSILFWRDISPKYHCSKMFENYMWARLIIQILLSTSEFFSNKKKE